VNKDEYISNIYAYDTQTDWIWSGCEAELSLPLSINSKRTGDRRVGERHVNWQHSSSCLTPIYTPDCGDARESKLFASSYIQHQQRRSPHLYLPFPRILPTVAFLFFFGTDSTNSPDCLPTLLQSMSVFYFLAFHFLAVSSVRWIKQLTRVSF